MVKKIYFKQKIKVAEKVNQTWSLFIVMQWVSGLPEFEVTSCPGVTAAHGLEGTEAGAWSRPRREHDLPLGELTVLWERESA